MARFRIENFFPITDDGQSRSIFRSTTRNMRTNVALSKSFTLTVGDEANLPTLAHEHLGDKDLWWALLMYNGWQDPINDVKSGKTILIPDRGQLLSWLETPRDRRANRLRI